MKDKSDEPKSCRLKSLIYFTCLMNTILLIIILFMI